MNAFKRLNIKDIFLALVILSATFVAVYFVFDPKEMAAKKHDSMYSPTAKTVQSQITEYFAKNKILFDSSFGFINGAEAVKMLGVEELFGENAFIMANLDKFYIGRESGKESSFYVCFVPQSKFVRDSHCNDSFVYTLNSDGSRSPVKCNPDSSWQDPSWVVCSPN